MARVTQRVDPTALADLVERPGRAALAFSRDDCALPVPVAYRLAAGQIWIGVDPEALGDAPLPERGVLLVDDGAWWFELRAVTWRGRLRPGSPPAHAEAERLRWLEFIPDHAVAWDYGSLHEEPEP